MRADSAARRKRRAGSAGRFSKHSLDEKQQRKAQAGDRENIENLRWDTSEHCRPLSIVELLANLIDVSTKKN
jgi:hypothetical protein